MESKTAEFNGTTIRYVTVGDDGNDLLLETEDICAVLGLTERPEDTELALEKMDLGSAGVHAMRNGNVRFYEWLQKEFAGYGLDVIVRP